MERLLLFIFKRQVTGGAFSPQFWKELAPIQQEIQAELNQLGTLLSFTLIECSRKAEQRSHLYYIEFEKAVVLQRFVLDAQNKVVLIKAEGSEKRANVREQQE